MEGDGKMYNERRHPTSGCLLSSVASTDSRVVSRFYSSAFDADIGSAEFRCSLPANNIRRLLSVSAQPVADYYSVFAPLIMSGLFTRILDSCLGSAQAAVEDTREIIV